jgi:predicted dienelactone hydrolase
VTKTYLASLAVVFGLLANEALAAGFQGLTIPDSADKPLAAGIWYPSQDPVRADPDNPRGQALALDGAVSGSGLALIVISHGNGGSFASHADMALALANAGFVVAAVTHTGDNDDDESYPISRWMVDRPRHVRLLIDYVLARWSGHARIDPTRIGMFGFSAGGYTTLVAIGGTPDPRRAAEHCAADPGELICRLGGTKDFSDPMVAAQLSSGWMQEARIRAAIIAAPGLGFVFDPASLASIKIPVQLWAAADDGNVPYASNTALIRTSLGAPPEFHEVAKAGHYSFLPICPRQLATLPKVWARICTDSPDFDRSAFHEEFNGNVVEFFSRHLPAEGALARSRPDSP